MKKHPIQPLEDVNGVLRFKQNTLVHRLLDFATSRGLSLNELLPGAPPEDAEQLAQLIGYSHSGAPSYVSSEVLDAAMVMHEAGQSELEARYQALLGVVKSVCPGLREAASVLFEKNPDDLCSPYEVGV